MAPEGRAFALDVATEYWPREGSFGGLAGEVVEGRAVASSALCMPAERERSMAAGRRGE